jgi:hypothetical protein
MNLPPLVPVCNLADAYSSIVIAACGFEDRTLALGQSLARGGIEEALLLSYTNWHEANRVADVTKQYMKLGAHIQILEYDRFVPDAYAELLYQVLEARSAPSVLLDISTMSKMAIMISLEVCRDLNLRTKVFYCEAQEYGPTLEQYVAAKADPEFLRPSIQVYSGVAGVTRTSRLSSVAMQGEPSAAIAFMSMNEMMTQSLLNALYPSRLFLINGRPPVHKWREQATAWIHEHLMKEWPEFDNPAVEDTYGDWLPSRSTSTLDYRETTAEICNLYWGLATQYRIILAPTGAKMQTVGAFIARAMHPDIHVEYPTPKGFLDFYSVGIGSKWSVDFGRLGDFIAELRNQDTKDHLLVLGENHHVNQD